jgi:hypothetical protein
VAESLQASQSKRSKQKANSEANRQAQESPVPVPVPVLVFLNQIGFMASWLTRCANPLLQPCAQLKDHLMNWIETEAFLRARRVLTRQVFDDQTVDAWSHVLAPWSYADCSKALERAALETDRITPAHIVRYLPPAVTRGPTDHRVDCECAGQGLLSSEEPDDHNPGQTYTVWRPCPGTRKRTVPNPGPEMSFEQYLALNRPPEDFDQRDHAFARRTAVALINDPGAAPLSAGNPLNALVNQYIIAVRAGL